MAEASLEDQAIAVLDQALRAGDPISRMMLIEHALKLHREALAARDIAPGDDAKPGDAADRQTR